MNFLLLLLFNGLYLLGESSTSTQQTCSIVISEVSNNRGHVMIALYKNASDFPDNPQKALVTRRVAAALGTVTVNIPDLAAGTYAFAIFHDENDNLKLDKGFFGIPKEGFCFSRQAMGTFGPPDFKDAAFEVTDVGSVQRVRMVYW